MTQIKATLALRLITTNFEITKSYRKQLKIDDKRKEEYIKQNEIDTF